VERHEKLARLDQLLTSGAAFHGSGTDASTFVNWQLAPEVLGWLVTDTDPGARTLETGCGYSTVAFALAGARHTAISPRVYEHDRVRQWCAAHDIALDTVEFVAGESQVVLPSLPADPLDVVLVDGDHAFPSPFIDWYYTAHRLRTGGLVVIDDTQLRTAALLAEFLDGETGRWARHRTFTRTAVFTKVSDEWRAPDGWVGQPFCAVPARPVNRVRRWLSRTRR
jgi:predicted O-methyltransferase YrrM